MLKTMEGRSAIVTGCREGGTGIEVAKLLLQDMPVYLTAHNKNDAYVAAKKLENFGEVLPSGLDVTDQQAVNKLAKKVYSRHGGANVLVNCAVIFPEEDRGVKASKVSINVIRRELEVNTLGSVRMTQAVLPAMQEANYGRIVQMFGSWGSYERALKEVGAKGGAGYGMSKAAELYFLASLAGELKNTHDGVLINAVDPGKVKTNMNPGGDRLPEEVAAEVVSLATLPIGSSTSGMVFRGETAVPFDSYV